MPVTIKRRGQGCWCFAFNRKPVLFKTNQPLATKTKKRVRKAMKELNYHPNLNARSLVSSYTQVIRLGSS